MATPLPRLIVAGLSGDSGKTVVSLSLLAALRQRGLTVSVFKKGPDYIDAAWLARVAGSECSNLDTYLVEPDSVYRRFTTRAAGSDVALIEGNRGLFDGLDASGTHSTAALSRLLRAPVVLVVDTVKATRTVAALVAGCVSFESDVRIGGVILNKVAGDRHERIIRDSIARVGDVPVLGAIPRLGDDASLIPGRHLGLVTPDEFGPGSELEDRLLNLAQEYLDVEALLDLARSAPTLEVSRVASPERVATRARIGYFHDSVFTFYYPENLEALRSCGAELVPVSSVSAATLPAIDALYIGGGFPETHAKQLAANHTLARSVREAAEGGLPIYAECGGLIYLSRSLTYKGRRYTMAGVFPHDLVMHARPVGHGYVRVQTDADNPFFDIDQNIRGHEFHYSALATDLKPGETCFRMLRGTGLGEGRDGLMSKNTLACYTHIHADGVTSWASSLVARAHAHSQERLENRPAGGGARRALAHQAVAFRSMSVPRRSAAEIPGPHNTRELHYGENS